MAHPNAEILRQADEAMERGDSTGSSRTTPTMSSCTWPGTGWLATTTGSTSCRTSFGRFTEAMGKYTFENHSYLADDEHGVILQRGKSVRDAETREFNEVFVFHFSEGKISEMWYVPVDQAAVDALIG